MNVFPRISYSLRSVKIGAGSEQTCTDLALLPRQSFPTGEYTCGTLFVFASKSLYFVRNQEDNSFVLCINGLSTFTLQTSTIFRTASVMSSASASSSSPGSSFNRRLVDTPAAFILDLWPAF